MFIKRRSKPRRGRVVDKAYLAFIAAQPCLICGEPATVHHVRTLGSPKDDTRALPLCPAHHMIQWGPESIEALGKTKFQERHGVDLEADIARLQELSDQRRAVAASRSLACCRRSVPRAQSQ